jgi:hypothetical protein
MATGKSASAKAQTEKQLEEIKGIVASLTQISDSTKDSKEKLVLLESVSVGLYEEVDKLSKKCPVDSVTDLVLNQMNDIIKETKELADDPYIQRLSEFVPAGDNPQQRDAVVVLRQIRQGLERHRKKIESQSSIIYSRLTEAKCIQLALEVSLDGDNLDQNDFKRYGILAPPERWFTGSYPHHFDYQRLARTDLKSYFEENR